MQDYYAILEVHPKASKEVIAKAFSILKARAQTKEEESLILEAYEVLSSEAKRSSYDAQMGISTTNSAEDEPESTVFHSEAHGPQNWVEEAYGMAAQYVNNVFCWFGNPYYPIWDIQNCSERVIDLQTAKIYRASSNELRIKVLMYHVKLSKGYTKDDQPEEIRLRIKSPESMGNMKVYCNDEAVDSMSWKDNNKATIRALLNFVSNQPRPKTTFMQKIKYLFYNDTGSLSFTGLLRLIFLFILGIIGVIYAISVK